MVGGCKELKEAMWLDHRDSYGGRKGLERAGPYKPMKDALLLVILVCYSENNGKTSCFEKIVPAVAWRMDWRSRSAFGENESSAPAEKVSRSNVNILSL